MLFLRKQPTRIFGGNSGLVFKGFFSGPPPFLLW